MDRIRGWCVDAQFDCHDGDDGTLLVRLDPAGSDAVRLDPPVGGEPLRLQERVALDVADLSSERLAEVIEDVVLGRSSLIDARPTEDGRGAEVVVVVHPEGLNRHTFLEAAFELQKVRLLLHREVAAAVAAEHTVATLEALAGEAWSSSPRSSA